MEEAIKHDPLTALLTFRGDPREKLTPGEWKNGLPVDDADNYDEFGEPWDDEE